MKKLLLLLSFLSIAFAASVAAYVPENGNLFPFAYDLRSEFDETTMTLTGWFSVNAPSNKITVYAKDSEEIVYKILELSNKPALKNQQFTFSFQGHLGKDFTWYVDVEGTSHSQALLIERSIKENKLYYPTSIDIDNNPQNANFGTVFCIEGRHDAASTPGYISSIDNNGAGLYVFNADGTKRALPYDSKGEIGVTVERYGWNGGKSLSTTANFGGATGFTAYRVRVSDDGRIFITSQTPNGEVLYEADKNVFSDRTGKFWGDRYWYRVISVNDNNGKANGILTYKTTKHDVCGHTWDYCNIYNLYNTNNEFVAGPNVGFDVRGSGKNLQLLMLSGCKQAITQYTPSHFYCSEYNLGRSTTWSAAPTNIAQLRGYVLRHNTAQVQYDKNGNIWMCQHITDVDVKEDDYTALLKYNRATGEVVKYSAKNNSNHRFHRCGAMRFNKDFTKFAITTRGGTSGSGGSITICPVVNGDPDFANGVEIDIHEQVGLTMMDFAWDYAGNLYVAADLSSGASAGRCVAIYAMPNNDNNVVSTPAASKYGFSTKYSGITWKNLYMSGQDVADEMSNYPGVNTRIWRLLQVGYNRYYFRDLGTNWNQNNEIREDGADDRTENGKTIINVSNYLTQDNPPVRLVDFYADDDKFSWLGDYIAEVSNVDLRTREICARYTEDFINCTGDYTLKGQPEYWRHIWVREVLGLNDKVGPEEYLPIRWNWTVRDQNYFDSIWISGWSSLDIATNTPPSLSVTSRPSQWYKFNTVNNRSAEGLSNDTHILAWRDGGVDGNIVHRVTRPNMELYATYVEKNIDENNPPANPANFDATNEDLFQLLDNRNFKLDDPSVAPTHNLTVTRHLAAGMYNTICLPMNIDLAGLLEARSGVEQHPLKYKEDGSGATVLEFTGVTPTTNAAGENVTVLNFTQVTEMKAGKPYLVKLRDGAEDYTEKMPFTTVSVHADAYHPVEHDDIITFVPTINPTTIPAGSIILVADNRLALTTEEGQMAGLRGYFTITDSNPARAKEIAEQAADGRVVFSVKRPLSTSVVVAPESEKQNAPKVQKLLHDGQIYIIRDDQTYTITGVRVK